MSEPTLSEPLWELLRSVDTPTICNAIEVAQGKRGFAAFTRGTMLASEPQARSVTGFACTATIAGAAPPDAPADVIRARRMAYFTAMAAGPRPAVAVVEDTDHPDCVGAWWGEVHVAVHRGLGMAGAVTNGVMRDLGESDPDFPVIAGSVGPSHGFVHVCEIGKPVSIFGLKIAHGDLVHADRHGAIVIPQGVVGQLEAAIATLQASEKLILDPARSADFGLEQLREAWARFEAART